MFRAERLPETCRVVIPIKLEFSASVGFIHKESVTMHGHTIVKYREFVSTTGNRFLSNCQLESEWCTRSSFTDVLTTKKVSLIVKHSTEHCGSHTALTS